MYHNLPPLITKIRKKKKVIHSILILNYTNSIETCFQTTVSLLEFERKKKKKVRRNKTQLNKG